jgi:hypothetical protein
MINKILVSLIVCFLLYFGYEVIRQQPIQNTNPKLIDKVKISKQQTPTVIEPQINNEDLTFSYVTAPVKKPLAQKNDVAYDIDMDKFDPLFDELSYGRYSSDPIEELFSVSSEIRECKRSISQLEAFARDEKGFTKLKLQQDIQCKNLYSQYPEIKKSRNDRHVKDLFINNAFNSSFANLFKRLAMKEKGPQIDQDIIYSFLRSYNAQMIRMLTKMLSRNKLTTITDKVSIELNITNRQYTKLITKQALEVYACQFNDGVTCKTYSNFMLEKCKTQKYLCGKDTMYWFNEYISQGHRNNLKIVIDVLQNVASS